MLQRYYIREGRIMHNVRNRTQPYNKVHINVFFACQLLFFPTPTTILSSANYYSFRCQLLFFPAPTTMTFHATRGGSGSLPLISKSPYKGGQIGGGEEASEGGCVAGWLSTRLVGEMKPHTSYWSPPYRGTEIWRWMEASEGGCVAEGAAAARCPHAPVPHLAGSSHSRS